MVHLFINSFIHLTDILEGSQTGPLSTGNKTANKTYVPSPRSWRPACPCWVLLLNKESASVQAGEKDFPQYRRTFILEVMVAIIRVLRKRVTSPSLLYKANLELAAVANNWQKESIFQFFHLSICHQVRFNIQCYLLLSLLTGLIYLSISLDELGFGRFTFSEFTVNKAHCVR